MSAKPSCLSSPETASTAASAALASNESPSLAPDLAWLLQEIRQEIEGHPLWEGRLREAPAGAVLLREFSTNTELLLILRGRVHLTKGEEKIDVDSLGSGALLGLISVATGELSMTTAHALTDAEFFVIDRSELLRLGSLHPRLKELFDPLIIRNLAERYRRLVGSNLEIHRLARELSHERNQLSETLQNLEVTRTALIAREKLATLGQLVAGIAHELNNPAAALEHGLATLREKLARTLHEADPEHATIFEQALTQLSAEALGQRERMTDLSRRHQHLPRPLLRRLSHCPAHLLDLLPPAVFEATDPEPAFGSPLARFLDIYETGAALRSIGVSGERIVRLVRSLKSYSRDGGEALEEVDLAEGIQDTLVVLQKPLRHIEVTTDLQGLPRVRCQPGPVNQVWTNLLCNAADAMQGRGLIHISGERVGDSIEVSVEDTGPGVPEAMRERIFAMNFTTKSGGAVFGLGLGLALSREIVARHGGKVWCTSARAPLGGARFIVRLPLNPPASAMAAGEHS